MKVKREGKRKGCHRRRCCSFFPADNPARFLACFLFLERPFSDRCLAARGAPPSLARRMHRPRACQRAGRVRAQGASAPIVEMTSSSRLPATSFFYSMLFHLLLLLLTFSFSLFCSSFTQTHQTTTVQHECIPQAILGGDVLCQVSRRKGEEREEEKVFSALST